jgi:integrase
MGQLIPFPRTLRPVIPPPVVTTSTSPIPAVSTTETGDIRTRTLADLFAHYAAEYLSDKAPNTQYQQRQFFGQVLRELGPVPLEDLTTDLLRTWKLALSARYRPSTVRKYLNRFGVVLRVGVEEFCWLEDNPMRRIRKPKETTNRVRYLTTDERHRLLAACKQSQNPFLYAIVQVALTTGGRKTEIQTLRWTEIDLDGGVIRFLKTKTNQPRAVPLVGEAHALLQDFARWRQPTVPWVFSTWNGRKPTPIEFPWQTAKQQAGLEDFRFHDLRHTFASYMAMSGASLREIADVLGHKSIQQTLIYTHLMPQHTHNVVKRMSDQFLSSPPPEEP